MKRLLAFPFSTAPLLLVVTFTVGLMIAAAAGLFGIVLGFFLISWFFKYCFVLLDAMVSGEEEPPVLSVEMVNPVGEQRPGAATILIAAAFWLTWSVYQYIGALPAALLAALLLAALPASLAVLAITRSAFKAASPGMWWVMVRGMGSDYLWLAAAVLACGACIHALWYFDMPQWVCFSVTQLLVLCVFALIGGVAHLHRHDLDLETLSPAERVSARDERDFSRERGQMLDQSYALLRIGKVAESWKVLDTWFTKHGAQGESLQEYHVVLAAMAAWDDPRSADRLADDYLNLLLARRRNGEALTVCEQRFAASPQFRPAGAARLAELAGLAGKRALRRQLEAVVIGGNAP